MSSGYVEHYKSAFRLATGSTKLSGVGKVGMPSSIVYIIL